MLRRPDSTAITAVPGYLHEPLERSDRPGLGLLDCVHNSAAHRLDFGVVKARHVGRHTEVELIARLVQSPVILHEYRLGPAGVHRGHDIEGLLHWTITASDFSISFCSAF